MGGVRVMGTTPVRVFIVITRVQGLGVYSTYNCINMHYNITLNIAEYVLKNICNNNLTPTKSIDITKYALKICYKNNKICKIQRQLKN